MGFHLRPTKGNQMYPFCCFHNSKHVMVDAL